MSRQANKPSRDFELLGKKLEKKYKVTYLCKTLEGKEKAKPSAFMKSKAYKENPEYTKIIEEVNAIIKNPNVVNIDYGFNAYKLKVILTKEESLGQVRIENGKIESATVILKEDATELLKVSDTESEYTFNIKK